LPARSEAFMTTAFRPAPRRGWRVASLLMTCVVAVACGGSSATVAPTTASASLGPTGPAEASIVPSQPPAASLTVQPTASPVTVVTPPPPTTSPPTAAPPTTPPALAIGVPIRIGDQQDMTVLAAEKWAGSSQVKPRSGKAFFSVSIKIDAIKLTSFDSADFKLKDAAGHSYTWRSGRPPHLYFLNNMTGGGTYTGWILYELPKGSLVGLTLVYTPRFLGGTSFRVPVS
jgi:Domain of unknown function (DUF4352)